MERAVSSVTSNEVIDGVIELLEAATHSILYHRNVYMRQHFRLCRKYHVPTPMSRSPLLCDYVAQALAQLRRALVAGVVERYAVVIVARGSARVLERFVFELSSVLPASPDWCGPLSLPAIEAHFRAFLLKLSVVDALLAPLRPSSAAPPLDAPEDADESDVAFNLVVHCSDGESANADEAIAQNWVPVNAAHIDGVPIIVPFKSANLGPLRLQLFCEENREAKRAED